MPPSLPHVPRVCSAPFWLSLAWSPPRFLPPPLPQTPFPLATLGHAQVLGTFLLWFGWYGFNPGSTLGIHGYARDAARCAVTTTLSACSGAVTGLYIKRMLPPKYGGTPGVWDLGHTCNSLLGGLVGITAGTSVTTPWAAVVIGFLSAWVYHGASCLMCKLKIDDPLDAFAVHGACGAWGCIAVGFFAHSAYAYSGKPETVDAGLFYGGRGNLIAIQCLGVLIEFAWVGFMAGLLFPWLNGIRVLRVSPFVEHVGADVSKHGGHAYPDENDPGLQPGACAVPATLSTMQAWGPADPRRGPVYPPIYPANDPRASANSRSNR